MGRLDKAILFNSFFLRLFLDSPMSFLPSKKNNILDIRWENEQFCQTTMSNIKVFTIDTIETEEDYCRDVLRCLLHTILFHRALGLVRPKEVVIDLLDLYYVQIDNEELIKKVDERIEALYNSLVKGGKDMLQVDVIFHERVPSKNWFGRTKEETVPWEQWALTVKLLKPSTHTQERREILAAQLTQRMTQIIQYVAESKNSLPALTTKDIISFPFKISEPTDKWSGFNAILEIFKSSPDPIGS